MLLHRLCCSNYRCTIVKHYYVGCCLIETKISGGAPRVWSRGVRPSSAISPLSTYNQMCLGPPLLRTMPVRILTLTIHCLFDKRELWSVWTKSVLYDVVDDSAVVSFLKSDQSYWTAAGIGGWSLSFGRHLSAISVHRS